MFGHDLNKTQIAQLVKDIVKGADINNDGDIAIDEFAQYLQSDECDLMNVITKYGGLQGDYEVLKKLAKESDSDLTGADSHWISADHREADCCRDATGIRFCGTPQNPQKADQDSDASDNYVDPREQL